MEFRPMPKTPRLSREVVITEKIDGTNASVYVGSVNDPTVQLLGTDLILPGDEFLRAGSRTRWITPEDDNYDFARWAYDNAMELVGLGLGHHFGEWWGKGINRNYGLTDRRFSLFNAGRWEPRSSWEGVPNVAPEGKELAPSCCRVVPVLYRGDFVIDAVGDALARLVREGSCAAPGFMDPEGVMVYHTAANQLFKKTIKGDEAGKSFEGHVKKERLPQEKRVKDPSKGGRRKEQLPFEGADRRQPK